MAAEASEWITHERPEVDQFGVGWLIAETQCSVTPAVEELNLRSHA